MLAEDPVTKKLYAVLSVNSTVHPRELVEIDNVTTGHATYIANVGLQFAAIAFGCDGLLPLSI